MAVVNLMIAGDAASRGNQSTGPGAVMLSAGGGYANGEADTTGGFGDFRMVAGGSETPFGAYVHGQLGRFGGDTFGLIDAEGGPMMSGNGMFLGLTTGAAYGGFARSALMIPGRVVVSVKPGPFGATGTFYGAFRMGDDDAGFDHAAAWGASLDLHAGHTLSLSPGLAWDRQDGVDVWSVRLSLDLHGKTK